MSTNSEGLQGFLQDNILTLLLFSDKGAGIVRGSIATSLFTSRPYRDIVTRAYAWIDKYGRAPKDHISDELEDYLSGDDDHAKLIGEALHKAKALSTSAFDEAYVIDCLEAFVRQQSLKSGIVQAYEALQAGNIEEAEAAIDAARKVRIASFDPGINLQEAITQLSNPDTQRDVLRVGIPELDRLSLGPAKKELHLFIAPAKRGKSWWLTHCVKRAMMQRWKGVYVTLELSDTLVAQRTLMALFARPNRRHEEPLQVARFMRNEDGKVEGIEHIEIDRPPLGRGEELLKLRPHLDALHVNDLLWVKAFPTGGLTVKGLEAYLDYLDQCFDFRPDYVVLDYADLMKIDIRNYRLDLGALFKDLRGLAFTRKFALATASQANRQGASSSQVRETDVAEDWSKIGTADCVLTYSQTMTERVRGLARILVASARTEADRFSVVVSQQYALGQFAFDSWLLRDQYYTFLPFDASKDDSNGTTTPGAN